MKVFAKPMSSPGRSEKFPPPLMRFLRSNVGSRSRGRSRSSPMFLRKKNTAIETQEPSSPKVTCMGQVRVKRSKSKSKSKSADTKRTRPSRSRRRAWSGSSGSRCRWIWKTLFCHNFSWRSGPKSCRPVCPSWFALFRRIFRRKSKVREVSSSTESKFVSRIESSEQEAQAVENEDEEVCGDNYRAKRFALSSRSRSPPKNALLLTRCRSAPYRSSSLAHRFWDSPLRNEETGEQQRETERENSELAANEIPCTDRRSISDRLRDMDPKFEEKLGFLKRIEVGSFKERISTQSENTEEFNRTQEAEDAARPLVLTRCKSEPSRTAESLDPELNSSRKRRLGIQDSCLPHVSD